MLATKSGALETFFSHCLRPPFVAEKVPRFVCHECRPRLVARIERINAAKIAAPPQTPTSAGVSSVPMSRSPSSGASLPQFMSRFLASPTDAKSKKREERDERMCELAKTWREEIVPNWAKLAGGRRVKQLTWEGIPPNMRKVVWPLLIGNKLSISPELFHIHGGRAFEVRKQSSQDGTVFEDARTANKEQTVMLIPVDIGRTFPLLGFFQEEGPQHEELRHVLEAYVCLRPDIGYVQGMSFMAAVLLLNLDCYTSFQCLANILNRKIFLEFFRMNMIQIKKYMLVLEDLILKYLPKISAQFELVKLTPDMYIVDWVLTLYSKALPLDLAMRVWDYFFFEGTTFIYRVALGILKYGAPVLETGDFESSLTWLTHLGRQGLVEEDLFEAIKSISFSKKQCQEIFDAYNLEL